MMMKYLNRDHPAFRRSPQLYIVASRLCLEAAIHSGFSFRLQCSRERLLAVAHPHEIANLLANCFPSQEQSSQNAAVATCEGILDSATTGALLSLLSFELEGHRDLPLNYIDTITIKDAQGSVLFHSTESNEFILISLAENAREALSEDLRARGIPSDVLERVDVDPGRLSR